MNITLNCIGNGVLHEASVDEINTSTMDKAQSLEFAKHLLCVASDILVNLDYDELSDDCDNIINTIDDF